MSKFEKIVISLAFASAFLFAINLSLQVPQPAFGSVNYANEYQSTTTRAANTGAAMASPTLIKNGYGTLGSVVITGSNTGIINILDATSTIHTDSGTTTLATFGASAAAGTYTFDAIFTKGLLVEINGVVASSTITYR